MSRPRFDAKPQYDIVHAETQVSKFEYLITLYCNVQNNYFFLFARKNEKEEEKKILIVLMQYWVLFYCLLKMMVT